MMNLRAGEGVKTSVEGQAEGAHASPETLHITLEKESIA